MRERFGPPRSSIGAFFWAALQLPRALAWQLREKELRAHALAPLLVTFFVGAALIVAAIVGAGPLEAALLTRGEGVGATLGWVAARVALTVVLIVVALGATWQLHGAIASAWLERMALFVQLQISGEAPPATVGALEVVRRAALGVFPRVKGLVAWLLSTIAAVTLILVPGFGPVLVIAAQAALAAGFLAHSTITENRARLGLPRRLLLREPALLLGLALALVPLVLVPPLLLVAGGPISIAGALVALGMQRRAKQG